MIGSDERAALITLGLEPLVSATAWPLVARSSLRRRFESGAMLWRAGHEGQAFCVVLSGRIRIVRARQGRQYLVHVAERGDTIGEVPVLDGAGYPATAIAASRAECVSVPRQVVRDLIERDGRVGRLFVDRLGRRVRVLVDRLTAQTLGDVQSRLAAALVGLSVEQGSATIRLPRPQAQWAEDLGTVRETLAREVARLVKRGAVGRVGRGEVRILDEVLLEQIALQRDSRKSLS